MDLQCIFCVLLYHIKRTKRNTYLTNILKPLKQDIVSGEVLRLYNNIKVDNCDQQMNYTQTNNNPNMNLYRLSGLPNMPIIDNYSPSLEKYANMQNQEMNENNLTDPNAFLYQFLHGNEYSMQFEMPLNEDTPNQSHLINPQYNPDNLHLVWGVRNNVNNGNVMNKQKHCSSKQAIYLKKDDFLKSSHKEIDQILIKGDREHFEYLKSLEDDLKNLSVTKTNPLFTETKTYQNDLNITQRPCNKLNGTIVSIPIEHEEQEPITYTDNNSQFNKTKTTHQQPVIKKDDRNSKVLNLVNQNIYLPPAPSINMFPNKLDQSNLLESTNGTSFNIQNLSTTNLKT